MNIAKQILGYIVSIPARMKGMRFGKGSFIGPGYDCISVTLKDVSLGNHVIIGRNAFIQTVPDRYHRPTITIGDKTQIGRNATMAARKRIVIGKNCLISYNVSILDHDHDVMNPRISPIKADLTTPEEVLIEDDCFIGAHSFILKGVHLGRHCVVGANSVVTKSFPKHSVIAGSPARLIKKLR